MEYGFTNKTRLELTPLDGNQYRIRGRLIDEVINEEQLEVIKKIYYFAEPETPYSKSYLRKRITEEYPLVNNTRLKMVKANPPKLPTDFVHITFYSRQEGLNKTLRELKLILRKMASKYEFSYLHSSVASTAVKSEDVIGNTMDDIDRVLLEYFFIPFVTHALRVGYDEWRYSGRNKASSPAHLAATEVIKYIKDSPIDELSIDDIIDKVSTVESHEPCSYRHFGFSMGLADLDILKLFKLTPNITIADISIVYDVYLKNPKVMNAVNLAVRPQKK